MKLTKPHSIEYELQDERDHVIQSLLDQSTIKLNFFPKGYITRTIQGRGNKRYFYVPLWAYHHKLYTTSYHGQEGYFIYYVAHELSHVVRDNMYNFRGLHDSKFYEVFLKICPEEYQYFELYYKPSSAAYGIKQCCLSNK